MIFCDHEGLIQQEAPSVSLLDHGFLFGDSIYEVCRVYDKRLFGWEEHRERFVASAARMGIPLSPCIPEIESRMKRVLSALNERNAIIRIIVTRGVGRLHIDPRTCTEPRIYMAAWKFSEEQLPKKIRVMVPSIRRNSREALDPAIKSGNYLNNVLAYKEAVEAGYDDALLLNSHGEVTEFTTSNVAWLEGSKLVTPSTEVGILHGVTRRIFKEAFGIIEGRYLEKHLKNIECLLVFSTMKELMPVNEVQLQSGEVLKFDVPPQIKEWQMRFRDEILRRLQKQPEVF